MMEQEKKYFAGWWLWVLALGIGTMIVLAGLSYVGLIGNTIVERKVFENSFQYSEARKTEIATFEAQLAEIGHKLSSDSIDSETRTNLEASAAAVRIQLSVARTRQ